MFVAWVIPLLIVGAVAIAYLSSKDDKPRCPYCNAFVAKNSSRCKACGAQLSWS